MPGGTIRNLSKQAFLLVSVALGSTHDSFRSKSPSRVNFILSKDKTYSGSSILTSLSY